MTPLSVGAASYAWPGRFVDHPLRCAGLVHEVVHRRWYIDRYRYIVGRSRPRLYKEHPDDPYPTRAERQRRPDMTRAEIDSKAGASETWTGAELAERDDWIHELTPGEIAALDAALSHARETGKAMEALTRDDFPLGELSSVVDRWLLQLDLGLGFVLVRGIPVERYGQDDSEIAYWGLGLHLGTPVSQNSAGDLLGHVRDIGADPSDPSIRLYKTHEQLGFHSDGADIIGLLCLQPARSGGESRIICTATIHEQIAERRPDLLPTLYEPIPFDRNEEQKDGEDPFFMFPICHTAADGRTSWFYIDWYIRGSQRHPEAPRLSASQIDLIDLIDEIAADPQLYLSMQLRQGDMQLCKNSALLHSRTEYVDYEEPERKRHLIRLWLAAKKGFDDGDKFLRGGIPTKDGIETDSDAIARS